MGPVDRSHSDLAMRYLLLFLLVAWSANGAEPIDREALVRRHNPINRTVDVDAPLSLGNGGFGFSADITGLQTLADTYHRHGIPVETLSRWAWYQEPNPAAYRLADANQPFTQADGRVVAYPTDSSGEAGQWLRRNPRNHPLAQIAFSRTDDPAHRISPADILNPDQVLDLWNGRIRSRFTLDGAPVEVTAACHPQLDLVAFTIRSQLLANGKLGVRLAFPRGHDATVKNTPPLDWTHPETHQTRVVPSSGRRVDLIRQRDGMTYHVAVVWQNDAQWTSADPHVFHLNPRDEVLEFVVAFAPQSLREQLPTASETRSASAAHWKSFWQSGAAVDFSGSTDPRAQQIERRIVLSRYLMAAQCAGDVPPQESGLTCSTWYGKHHTEMIWWHTAHFALWGHDDLLARNLAWYQKQLPVARAISKRRGLQGARWPKMVGPHGRESPGGNPLIVWNQPHCIYLCELLYRNTPTRETLEQYQTLVMETADGLSSMMVFEEARGHYVLGPPLWIAQEIYDRASSQNPSFELAYWAWALEVAQKWRERRGQPRKATWDHVLAHLPPLPQNDGKYVSLQSHPDTWDDLASRHDHPTVLGPLGILPDGPLVDRATMQRTLQAVLDHWDWEAKIWGWDYPMIAMTATRLGRPETAVEILLREGPNNIYLPSGHCPQRSDRRLPPDAPRGARKREIAAYLPANGACLSAVALMVAGWDGCDVEFPGFPQDGTWVIRAEGLHRLP